MAFYELRQYFVRPGKMDEWVKIMEEEIIPFQVSKGMVICGSFRGETDESAYFWLRRFNSEAELVAKLSHPNTVNIYDFGQDPGGALFIAMEYLEGRSLRALC